MKKTIAVLLATALMVPMAVHAANYVTVSGADGSKTSFRLDVRPEVTFTATSLVMSAGDDIVEYPITDYRSFTLTDDNESTAVTKVSDSEPKAVFSFDGTLHGEGLKAGSRVSIYTINGETVGSATASATGTVDIPLNGRGIYIVRTPEKSFKIIKK